MDWTGWVTSLLCTSWGDQGIPGWTALPAYLASARHDFGTTEVGWVMFVGFYSFWCSSLQNVSGVTDQRPRVLLEVHCVCKPSFQYAHGLHMRASAELVQCLLHWSTKGLPCVSQPEIPWLRQRFPSVHRLYRRGLQQVPTKIIFTPVVQSSLVSINLFSNLCLSILMSGSKSKYHC